MHPMYDYIKTQLKGFYTDGECGALAKWILTDALHLSVTQLYGCKDANFSSDEMNLLTKIINRLSRHEPMQYILGDATFLGLRLSVTPDVLIPRPETEELAEWVISSHREAGLRVLDIGTGSGCIAIALALGLREAAVTAWDVSAAALAVASRNARALGAGVSFELVDILSADIPLKKTDIIVSNPPYVTLSERAGMSPNVLKWEPHTALFVPDDDPLLFYRAIAARAAGMLDSGGTLYFEINQCFGREVVSLLQGMGYGQVELRRDLSGNDRMVRGIKC